MLEQAKVKQREMQLRSFDREFSAFFMLPSPSNSIDIVVTRYSLHHMLDSKRILRYNSYIPKCYLILHDGFS